MPVALSTTVAAARIGLIWTYSVGGRVGSAVDYRERGTRRTQNASLQAEKRERVARIHRSQEEADGKRVFDGFATVKGDDEGAFAAAAGTAPSAGKTLMVGAEIRTGIRQGAKRSS